MRGVADSGSDQGGFRGAYHTAAEDLKGLRRCCHCEYPGSEQTKEVQGFAFKRQSVEYGTRLQGCVSADTPHGSVGMSLLNTRGAWIKQGKDRMDPCRAPKRYLTSVRDTLGAAAAADSVQTPTVSGRHPLELLLDAGLILDECDSHQEFASQ